MAMRAFKLLGSVSILGVLWMAKPAFAERIVSETKTSRLQSSAPTSDVATPDYTYPTSQYWDEPYVQPGSDQYRTEISREKPEIKPVQKIALPKPSVQTQGNCGGLQGDLCKLFKLTNQERKSKGLTALKFDPNCQKAASTHAADMARRSYFNHRSPEGSEVTDRYPGRWRMIGENIAAGKHMDVNGAIAAWMNSPGHRRNILNAGFNSLGVGIKVQNGKRYFVQCFSKI